MEIVGDTYFYITWDATHIYVAFTRTIVSAGDVCVVFDTAPGGATAEIWGAQFDAGVAPEYFVGMADGGYVEYRFGDAGGWLAGQNVAGHGDWGQYGGWTDNENNEIRIPRSWLGNLAPAAPFNVMAWTTDNAHSQVWTAFPTPALDGPAPGAAPVTFSAGYEYGSSDQNVEPRGDFSYTAVELVSFTARGLGGTVVVKWETASEVDTEGFYVWRSETETGDFEKVNLEIVPAEGDVMQGARYSYTDTDSGLAYWYKLEEVDIYGGSFYHGPVESVSLAACGAVTAQGGHGVAWAFALILPAVFILALRRRMR